MELKSLSAEPHLLPHVTALAPRPDQLRFSGSAAQQLADGDGDPALVPFAIVADGRPAGFGIIDRAGDVGDGVMCPPSAAQLRGFYVDAAQQGRGIGSAAIAQLPWFVPVAAPGVERLWLIVHDANPPAVATYLHHGFHDTGARFASPHGTARVLRWDLSSPRR